MENDKLLFQWRKMIASEQGPESTTRHVLLTLALHMDGDGGSCFPSTRTLAAETGLSRRSVEKHINSAKAAGWIEIEEKAGSGRSYRRHSYAARIPKELGEPTSPTQPPGLGEPTSPTKARLGESGARLGESDDINLGNDVPLSTSLSTPKNSSGVFSEIVSYLNKKTGKNFRASTKATKAHINARINEGFSVNDFFRVIDTKTALWLNDPKMAPYLRPETLFGTKFEAYLNEAPPKQNSGGPRQRIVKAGDPELIAND